MERILLGPSPTSHKIEAAVAQAAEVLRAGGLVIYPTETVYGVGADATNPQAVSRMLKYKQRPAGKPVSVLVADQEAAESIVTLNDTARDLYKTYLPGPVTVISEDRGIVDPRLVSELGTLGIRISSGEIAQNIAKTFQKPISATSANASGKARPYNVDVLLEALSESQRALISLIIDVGTLPRREPSTVIDTTTGVQQVLRAGESFHSLMPDVTTSSEEETIALGTQYAGTFLSVLPEKPVVFALEGEMGVGKTRFAKGVATALGVQTMVSSPTYALMKEYQGETGRLVHIDCWRTPEITPTELELDALLKPGTIAVIEWAHPLLSYLKDRQEAGELVGYHVFLEYTSVTDRLIKAGSL